MQLKIRYDDFSTYSIQETADRLIASAEDMFSRAKLLLKKKYTGGNIRLLGAGALNLEQSAADTQGELFDFGDGKAKILEQTVLQIKQKDPSIKITKARLLKDIFS